MLRVPQCRGLVAACVVAYISSGGFNAEDENTVLEADCAVDPSASGCHRPSLFDMISGINNRAQAKGLQFDSSFMLRPMFYFYALHFFSSEQRNPAKEGSRGVAQRREQAGSTQRS